MACSGGGGRPNFSSPLSVKIVTFNFFYNYSISNETRIPWMVH